MPMPSHAANFSYQKKRATDINLKNYCSLLNKINYLHHFKIRIKIVPTKTPSHGSVDSYTSTIVEPND